MPTNISMKVDAFVDLNVGAGLSSGDLIPIGSTITLNATPKSGYAVKGWYIKGTVGTGDPLTPLVVDGIYTENAGDYIKVGDSSCTINAVLTSTTVSVIYTEKVFTVE